MKRVVVTLRDVAREANTSIGLVSKVLSGRMGTTGCSEQTQELIIAKAREMGYKANPLAVALRTGRKAAIGVFIHPIGEEGSGLIEGFLTGVAEALNACNQRLWLAFYQTDQQFLQRCSRTARAEIDGLIVAGLPHRELSKPIRAIEKTGVPVVTAFPSGGLGGGVPNVSTDNRELTRLATGHLIERGCRHIAHIHTFDERLEGYRAALREHNLKLDPSLVYHARNFKLEQGTAAIRQWLEQGVSFDGVVAQSDHQALGAIHELQRRGLEVPGNVRVVGIDDSPLCDACEVPLTSVSQKMSETGRCAVNLLLQRIDGKPASSETVAPSLHVRASS